MFSIKFKSCVNFGTTFISLKFFRFLIYFCMTFRWDLTHYLLIHLLSLRFTKIFLDYIEGLRKKFGRISTTCIRFWETSKSTYLYIINKNVIMFNVLFNDMIHNYAIDQFSCSLNFYKRKQKILLHTRLKFNDNINKK